ncbi:MAG TPA: DUF305 domain-containing protein [Cyanobacteria bacterium UBA8530]|nr:DUF305 domain-containing protein [Cyanobacteria bacterium UBA8530]
MKASLTALAVCAFLLVALPLQAKTTLTSRETAFMTEAAQGGLAEVSMGSVAEKQAETAEVKQFGQRMVKDHTSVNNKLMALAQKKGVNLPKEPSAKQKKKEMDLAKMKGMEFDRAYMKEMVTDHTKDVQAFRKASKDSKDADLKRFAADALPFLEEHLRLAKDLSKRLKK